MSGELHPSVEAHLRCLSFEFESALQERELDEALEARRAEDAPWPPEAEQVPFEPVPGPRCHGAFAWGDEDADEPKWLNLTLLMLGAIAVGLLIGWWLS